MANPNSVKFILFDFCCFVHTFKKVATRLVMVDLQALWLYLCRFNSAEVLGCRLSVQWYRDVRKVYQSCMSLLTVHIPSGPKAVTPFSVFYYVRIMPYKLNCRTPDTYTV